MRESLHYEPLHFKHITNLPERTARELLSGAIEAVDVKLPNLWRIGEFADAIFFAHPATDETHVRQGKLVFDDHEADASIDITLPHHDKVLDGLRRLLHSPLPQATVYIVEIIERNQGNYDD